ncbi:MAG TPA: hypothetical protein PLJ89_02085 [Thermoleophilia bacterium]|nr:hypothetical protein [Acidobacteriota bacterium]OPZ45448.1 MAG: hypothetical protein BWY94_01341 [Actinobacteria bacterium ADurb.BinA094]HOU28335.1 hypothetical protein [Thermoleophilia bacterium]HQF51505.1 hypothetical protein [Thermoleophilia bacterium]HQH20884.1 hypothetical protein [Thermoleophilia bacterium]
MFWEIMAWLGVALLAVLRVALVVGVIALVIVIAYTLLRRRGGPADAAGD